MTMTMSSSCEQQGQVDRPECSHIQKGEKYLPRPDCFKFVVTTLIIFLEYMLQKTIPPFIDNWKVGKHCNKCQGSLACPLQHRSMEYVARNRIYWPWNWHIWRSCFIHDENMSVPLRDSSPFLTKRVRQFSITLVLLCVAKVSTTIISSHHFPALNEKRVSCHVLSKTKIHFMFHVSFSGTYSSSLPPHPPINCQVFVIRYCIFIKLLWITE